MFTSKNSNKRNYERMAIDGNAIFRINDNADEALRVSLDNISFGGFSIYSKEKFEIDKMIDFELMLTLVGETLRGKGKIRYISQPKKFGTTIYVVGVEFVEIDRDNLAYVIKRIQTEIVNRTKGTSIVKKKLDFFPY